MGMHKSGRNDTKNPGAPCTLENYLVQKYPEEIGNKKLTFEEWWVSWIESSILENPGDAGGIQIFEQFNNEDKELIFSVWKAAQENK